MSGESGQVINLDELTLEGLEHVRDLAAREVRKRRGESMTAEFHRGAQWPAAGSGDAADGAAEESEGGHARRIATDIQAVQMQLHRRLVESLERPRPAHARRIPYSAHKLLADALEQLDNARVALLSAGDDFDS